MIYTSSECNLKMYKNTIFSFLKLFVTIKMIHTLGGLNGYSGVKWISKKKTPPSYTEPGGPKIVLTHSYTLSPFGPAL